MLSVLTSSFYKLTCFGVLPVFPDLCGGPALVAVQRRATLKSMWRISAGTAGVMAAVAPMPCCSPPVSCQASNGWCPSTPPMAIRKQNEGPFHSCLVIYSSPVLSGASASSGLFCGTAWTFPQLPWYASELMIASIAPCFRLPPSLPPCHSPRFFTTIKSIPTAPPAIA